MDEESLTGGILEVDSRDSILNEGVTLFSV